MRRPILSMLAFAVLCLLVVGAVLPIHRSWGRDRVAFPHDRHDLSGQDCESCHKGVADSHNLREGISLDLSSCGTCHEDADLAKWGYSPHQPAKPRIEDFSHNDHLPMGKSCTDCHGALLKPELAAESKGMPNHGLCFECHDNVTKTNDCRFCHTDLREGRLTHFQRDPSIMKPMDHHPGFLHDHLLAARLDGKGCAECHRQEDFCSSCHQGSNVDYLVHSKNWLYEHPNAARKNLQDCSACHDRGTYCTECHLAQGIKPGNHLSPFWVAREHANQARRDVALCSGCHDNERLFVCVRCHQDDGVRGNQRNLSPHAGDFRDTAGHGYWHDDYDGAACRDCHRNKETFCVYCHESRN